MIIFSLLTAIDDKVIQQSLGAVAVWGRQFNGAIS